MSFLRSLFKALILLLIGGAILAAMWYFGLLDFSLIYKAFHSHWQWLLLLAGAQFAAMILLAVRYVFVARSFAIQVRLRHLLAATFVSTAMGQWAPGSLAFIEAIRLGLLLGTDKVSERSGGEREQSTRRRIVVSSLYDRLIGFWVILLIGFLITASLVLYSFFEGRPVASHGLFVLLFFSGAGVAGLSAVPSLARAAWVIRLLREVLARLLALRDHFPVALGRKLLAAVIGLLRHAESMREVLATRGANHRGIVASVLVSAMSVFFSVVGTWLAAVSIGANIPFVAIAAALPVIAVAGLFPLGFAGMGAYQLVSIVVFDLFSVDPKVAAAANLLQTALALGVCTVLGIVFAGTSLGTLRLLVTSSREAA
jgi:uncharacterized membrane protein YbhN (UPF0104 family)